MREGEGHRGLRKKDSEGTEGRDMPELYAREVKCNTRLG